MKTKPRDRSALLEMVEDLIKAAIASDDFPAAVTLSQTAWVLESEPEKAEADRSLTPDRPLENPAV